MTKKDLIEGGWIDKYILGLTSDVESQEVERLANLYPEVQEDINLARGRICGKFNRNLTQPALRHTMITKRRVLYGSAVIVIILLLGFAFLYREHRELLDHFNSISQMLDEDEAKLTQLTSLSQSMNETGNFLHAPETRRIRLQGCSSTPNAEVMVFQCSMSGKMMLRVIDLPELPASQHYEVWAKEADQQEKLLGSIQPPLRYDSLYVLNADLNFKSLRISAVDSANAKSEPICLATVSQ